MRNTSCRTVGYFGAIYLIAGIFIYYAFSGLNFYKILHLVPKILFIILFMVAAEHMPISLSDNAEVTVGFAIVLSSLLTFGTRLSIMTVLISSIITEFKRRKVMPLDKAAFNISMYVIMVGVAGCIYEKIGGIPGQFNIYSDLPRVLVLILSYLFINVGLVTIALSIYENKCISRIFFNNFKWALPNYLALVPLGILLSVIYTSIGMLAGLLFFTPLLVARHSFKLYMNVRKVYLDTIQALATTIEAKDSYTHGHSDRVARYCLIIAEEMNLSNDFINTLNYAALLHDIGKIGIPEEILNKPGKLSEEEFNKVKLHPELGASIVEKLDFLVKPAVFIKSHHERLNGSGYPQGLCGKDIPLGASILAVADAFDAMTSDRPYRKAWSVEETMVEIERNSGIQFQAEVVQALKQALEKGRIRVNAG